MIRFAMRQLLKNSGFTRYGRAHARAQYRRQHRQVFIPDGWKCRLRAADGCFSRRFVNDYRSRGGSGRIIKLIDQGF